MLFLLLALFAAGLETGCSSQPRFRTKPPAENPAHRPRQPQPASSKGQDSTSTQKSDQVGLASFYAHKFHGRPTASGEIFDMHILTAAHRTLPLGTVVRVTHLENGRSVTVKVNDRGPFIEGRILDLSLGAAKKLDMLGEGVARVRIEIVKAID